MTPEKTAQVVEEVESQIASEVITALTGAKETVLAAQRRLPQEYPELAQEGVTPTRAAVLHGDLSILVGMLAEAVTQAHTAATGVLQDNGRTAPAAHVRDVRPGRDGLLSRPGPRDVGLPEEGGP